MDDGWFEYKDSVQAGYDHQVFQMYLSISSFGSMCACTNSTYSHPSIIRAIVAQISLVRLSTIDLRHFYHAQAASLVTISAR
jgi:hypothetical protein